MQAASQLGFPLNIYQPLPAHANAGCYSGRFAKGKITDQIGRTVLEIMFETRQQPEAIIEEQGLRPIQDTELLEKVLDTVVAENSDIAVQIKEGETKPIDFLIGQVMRKTSGKADPKRVRELIQKKLT